MRGVRAAPGQAELHRRPGRADARKPRGGVPALRPVPVVGVGGRDAEGTPPPSGVRGGGHAARPWMLDENRAAVGLPPLGPEREREQARAFGLEEEGMIPNG